MSANTAATTAGRLGGQAAYFLIGNVFTLLVGFPLQIFIARKLGADSLGIYSLLDGAVGLMSGLIAFGVAPTLVKFIPYHFERSEYGCIRRLVARGTVVLVIAGTLSYVGVLLLFPMVSTVWPVVRDYRDVVLVMTFLVPLGLISFLLQQGLRGFQEIRYIVIGSSFLQLTAKALLVVGLLIAGFQLIGYAVAIVLSTAVAVVWMYLGMRRKIAEMPHSGLDTCTASAQQQWNRYARVMYSGSLLGIGNSYLDRFLLGAMAGAGPVGILAVVRQLQQLPAVFHQMFLSVAAPMFSAAHSRNAVEECQHLYHLTTDWVIRLAAPLFVFLLIFAGPVLTLFGPRFAEEGTYALRVLLVAQLVNLAFGPVGNLMNMTGLELPALKLSALQVILTLVGFIIFVPTYALAGAAWVILVGTAFINIVSFIIAKKTVGLHWFDRRYGAWTRPALVCVTAGLGLNQWWPVDPGAFSLTVFLLTSYLTFLLVSVAQGLSQDDRVILAIIRARVQGR